jgi:hypothetical protein
MLPPVNPISSIKLEVLSSTFADAFGEVLGVYVKLIVAVDSKSTCPKTELHTLNNPQSNKNSGLIKQSSPPH